MIKLLIMDVDGTLTDGKIYIGADGEVMKAFNIKDGLMITRLPEYGITPVIITGRSSQITNKRCIELGIKEVHQGILNKIDKLNELLEKYNYTMNEVAYAGDDILDLECMGLCGVTGCPADAVKEVKEISHFVSDKNGGDGAVREFIEWIINNSR